MFRKKIGLVLGLVVFILGELWLLGKVGYIKVISQEFNLFSQIAQFKDGKITGAAGANGFLVYGPYVPLPKGKYAVKFSLVLNTPADDIHRKVGYADVNVVGQGERYTMKELSVGDFKATRRLVIRDSLTPGQPIVSVEKVYQSNIILRFKIITGNPQTEFRLFQYAGNGLTVEGIYLRPYNVWDWLSALRNNFLKINLILIGLLLLAGSALYTRKQYQKKLAQGLITYRCVFPEKDDSRFSLFFIVQALIISVCALLMLNSYILDKLNWPFYTGTEILLLLAESGLFWLFLQKRKWSFPHVRFDRGEGLGVLLVFLGVGYVLLKPSLPTMMPINFSTDGVYHFSCIDYIYRKLSISGSGVSSYPFGYHLTTALLSRFTGFPHIKMMHVLLVFSVAFSTALVYALILRLFSLKRDGQILGLLVVLTLFWVRGYYELSFNAFFHAPMIFSYVFLLSFLWALIEYRWNPHWFCFAAMNCAGIGLVYTYTSYLPLLIIPLLITVLFRVDRPFLLRVRDVMLVLAIPLALAFIHLQSGSTGKIGLEVLNHEGWCIPFRFGDFGDFGEHRIGGVFLVLALLGLPFVITGFQANTGFLSFTFGVLAYFGILFCLKHYRNIFSYYQAYKILYFTPYLGVVFIMGLAHSLRRQLIEKYYPVIEDKIYKILTLIWLIFLLWFGVYIFKVESYKPNYLEMIREPVYRTMEWARHNVKGPFTCLYHHNMVGHWMRGGFLYDIPSGLDKDEYYREVIAGTPPTLVDWLASAKKGDIAVIDDLNAPPLNEEQKLHLEVLFHVAGSAVIKKR